MKNLLLWLIMYCLPLHSLIAQDLPNTGFEIWEQQAGGLYSQPQGWSTLNILALIGSPQTATQTTDAASGTYAARLETKTFFGNLIAGLLYLGNFDIAQGVNGLQPGVPFSGGRPNKFTGTYKYLPVNGDSAVVFAQLWHYNTQTNKRDTVAEAATSILNTASTYTNFELDFNYFSTEQPDSVYIVLISSGGGQNGQGQNGSTLFIDNVAFQYNTGTVPLFGSNLNQIQVYPTPTQNQLTIQLPAPLQQGSFELYNLQQQLVLKSTLAQAQTTLYLQNLPSGIYTYRINAAGMVVKKGRVQVVR